MNLEITNKFRWRNLKAAVLVLTLCGTMTPCSGQQEFRKDEFLRNCGFSVERDKLSEQEEYDIIHSGVYRGENTQNLYERFNRTRDYETNLEICRELSLGLSMRNFTGHRGTDSLLIDNFFARAIEKTEDKGVLVRQAKIGLSDRNTLIYLGKTDRNMYFCLGKADKSMIKRKIDNKIENFYKNHDKALLLTGARQTGKTFAIRRFGADNFDSIVEINFVENRNAIGFLDGAADAKEMIFRISALAKTKMIPGKTLIFFDEVQEYPEIVTLIKFLVEEGSYRYAMSGSLLGVELKDLRSEPVGYMDIFDMYPLDFEEFALAVGVAPTIIDTLEESFRNRIQVDRIVHERMMKVFQLYLVVGGMPAAVSKYIDTNNLRLVEEEQKAIIKLYKKDIAKYDPEDKLYLNDIFDLIPSELNSKNKRFILKNLNENFKFNRYRNSFLWLKNAGVALPTYNVEEPKYPLKLAEQRNLFKLFLNDVGLLTCQYSDGLQLKLLRGKMNVNYGGIFENAAAQELTAHGFSLAYFNNKKQGELDFVVTYKEKILPIEIKSGKNYERHSAMDNVLKIPNYEIESEMVFCNDNLSVKGPVTYCPVYMLMFLQNEHIDKDVIYKLDLQGIS